MFREVFDLLSVGCRHARLSLPFPMAAARSDDAHVDWVQELPPCSHYVVCLACGKRFAYDWQAMKIIRGPLRPPA